jgi:hypothetical protein
MTATSYSQAALASGRPFCVSLGLINTGARKKSSSRVVGVVGASVALCGVRAIIVARFNAAHYLAGHGGYKTGYGAIDPAQLSLGHFLMLFVGLLGSAVKRLLGLDEDAQWIGGE